MQATYNAMALSIAAYEASPEISAFSSKYDAVIGKSETFTAQEQMGYGLFRGKARCNECHRDGGPGEDILVGGTTAFDTNAKGLLAILAKIAGLPPGMTLSSLSVPLVAPNTEFGDRLNQLDFNVSKTIKMGRVSVQPKFDLFNALNVSPVYAVRTMNFLTASYLQPQSILNGRVFQLGAILKF